MNKKQWFKLHQWAGLQFSLLLCFVLLTGTLATISHDIAWLINPAMRSTSDVDIKNINWPAIYESAHNYCPQCQLTRIQVSKDRWFNVETIALDKDKQRFRIFHDRATGKITGTGKWLNIQQLLRQLHRHLMLPKQIGITLVCLMVIPIMMALISSFFVYRQWYKQFFTLPRLFLPSNSSHGKVYSVSQRKRYFWRELHKFIGIWSIWFMLLISITGSWYLAERWGLEAIYPKHAPDTHTPSDSVQLTPQRLTSLISIAKITYPTLTISSIYLPTPEQPYLMVQGQATAILVRDKANHVALDIHSGKVLSLRHGDQLTIHQRISEAADPLHFGMFGGGMTRWLWFVFGLMLSGMTLAGIYLWASRILSQEREKQASYLSHTWLAMGWLRWPIASLLTISLIFTLKYLVT